MTRSFQLVDWKVGETEFFLNKIQTCKFDLFATQCFANSFVYNARIITFTLQSVLSDLDGFDRWYKTVQNSTRET